MGAVVALGATMPACRRDDRAPSKPAGSWSLPNVCVTIPVELPSPEPAPEPSASQAAPPRRPSLALPPEAWLAAEAAAAWSGMRDRPRGESLRALRAVEESDPSPDSGPVAASTTTAAAAPSPDAGAEDTASPPEEPVALEEDARASEDAKDRARQALARQRIAALYGGGEGYTGVGAGAWGHTGVGGGDGFTGIGGGQGFTGFGAGAGFTGTGGSREGLVGEPVGPNATENPARPPTIILLPMFAHPWGFAYPMF